MNSIVAQVVSALTFLHSLGQVRTIGTGILSVRAWGYSRSNFQKSRHSRILGSLSLY